VFAASDPSSLPRPSSSSSEPCQPSIHLFRSAGKMRLDRPVDVSARSRRVFLLGLAFAFDLVSSNALDSDFGRSKVRVRNFVCLCLEFLTRHLQRAVCFGYPPAPRRGSAPLTMSNGARAYRHRPTLWSTISIASAEKYRQGHQNRIVGRCHLAEVQNQVRLVAATSARSLTAGPAHRDPKLKSCSTKNIPLVKRRVQNLIFV
jgi:hypothetical protein